MFSPFENNELTEQDEELIKEIFAHGTVKKYLTILGTGIAQDMISVASDFTSPVEERIQKQIYCKGQLDLLATLLRTQQIAAESSKE